MVWTVVLEVSIRIWQEQAESRGEDEIMIKIGAPNEKTLAKYLKHHFLLS